VSLALCLAYHAFFFLGSIGAAGFKRVSLLSSIAYFLFASILAALPDRKKR
jgi:hypothetical protein